MEILVHAVCGYARGVWRQPMFSVDVAGIGITSQRETTILWDKNTRTADSQRYHLAVPPHSGYCGQAGAGRSVGRIRRMTGLVPDAYFSGTKISGCSTVVERTRRPSAEKSVSARWIPGWWRKLTGGKVHITDATNAARDDLRHSPSGLGYDHLLHALDIPSRCCRALCSSSEVYGSVFPAGRRYSDCRHCGRPAGGTVRSDLLCGRRSG